jgi:hypothetical protein
MFKRVLESVRIGVQHVYFRDLVAQERNAAMQSIRQQIESLTPEQFDEFEQAFVTHMMSIVGFAHRLRAIELYAYLKLWETGEYGQFRGYFTDGSAL